MRIVFFGTPEFAVPSLRALMGEGFDLIGAVTQPDRPQGRSRSKPVPSAIKREAELEGIPVLQPERPSDASFIQEVRSLEPDLGVVVAYGHILKRELLDAPRLGMVNVHPSLLPQLRGAGPIPWTIKEGLETTGVTIFQMVEEIDAGPILYQLSSSVAPDETGGELAVRLAELGAQALVLCLSMMEQGAISPRPQDHPRATFTQKIDRNSCRIPWNEDAMTVARTIRAFDPRPGAWSELNGREIKLFGATHGAASGEPGEIISVEPDLIVAAALGSVHVREVQPAGRHRMSAAGWVRGRGAAVGQRLQ